MYRYNVYMYICRYRPRALKQTAPNLRITDGSERIRVDKCFRRCAPRLRAVPLPLKYAQFRGVRNPQRLRAPGSGNVGGSTVFSVQGKTCPFKTRNGLGPNPKFHDYSFSYWVCTMQSDPLSAAKCSARCVVYMSQVTIELCHATCTSKGRCTCAPWTLHRMVQCYTYSCAMWGPAKQQRCTKTPWFEAQRKMYQRNVHPCACTSEAP